MDIEIWSVGKVKFTADTEYQEPVIREAIDQRGDVASVIVDYTDGDRDVTPDEYARVTGDVPGLVLFEGWLTGDRDAPPPAAAAEARTCGHEFELGDVAYACQRAPHPVDGHLRLYRHAAVIDASHAEGTDEGDGRGTADLVTWGEDGAGDGQGWEVAWGSISEWEAGIGPGNMSAPARAARAAFLSHPGGNRLGNDEGWEAAAQAVLDSRTPWGDVNVVTVEQYSFHAVVRSGGANGDEAKVIGWGKSGLRYYDSVAEWQRIRALDAAGTPGQAACIAWNSHHAERYGIEVRSDWAASGPRERGAWEAAAIAAQQSQPATETKLRLALAFVEQASDGAYGDLPGLYAQQVLNEIAGLDS